MVELLQDEDPNQLRFADQRRLLSRVALSISLILVIYLCIVMYIMPVMTVGKYIAAVAALLIGSLSFLCHHEKLYTASATSIVVITIVGGVVASLSNGGADGFVAPIIISAPVIAALFIGARATLVSAIGVIAAIVSLLYLERIGFVSEAPYSAETLNIAAVVMLAASTGICASGVGYFAHAMQAQIRSLRESQDRLLTASEQLDHSAHHDTLTGLANRQGMHRYLDAVLTSPSRADQKIFLAHVDLDKFKSINDTYGHPIGDEVLKTAARVMNQEFDASALVARIGGDEFLIVSVFAADTPQSELQAKCENLVRRLKSPMTVEQVTCQIGASIGFVVSAPQARSIDSLMTDADLALYSAKRNGRGQARAFEASMRDQLERDRVFRIEIESALENDGIVSVLQPQVCVRSGDIVGVESLGRIRSRSGELLSPVMILPVLTEMGRLAEFDFEVMKQSLDALIALRRAGHAIPSVSINASADSLRSPDYVSRVLSEVESRGLAPADLVVEILESTLIVSSDDAAVTSIYKLREAGVAAIMDDFGSGHATISNMLKLELDGLKVDRSLTADLDREKTLKLVRAVNALAKDLEFSVIIEGVETAQQFDLLRRIGCEMVQGFGICKPLHLEAFDAWMRDYGRSSVDALQDRLHNLA